MQMLSTLRTVLQMLNIVVLVVVVEMIRIMMQNTDLNCFLNR